jgi:hypothetical protein
MKVAQQKAAQPHIVTLDSGLFFGKMCFKQLDGGLAHVCGASDQPHFNHPACLKGLPRLGQGGLDQVPAAATAHGHNAAGGKAHQRLAHNGSAAVKQHGQLLLAQACAGREFLSHHSFNDAVADVGSTCHRPPHMQFTCHWYTSVAHQKHATLGTRAEHPRLNPG